MYISTSTDWNRVEQSLLRRAKTLAHGREVIKMIGNISPKITELSKAEVLGRQRMSHSADKILAEVNADIEVVEEFLLVAALLG